MKKKILHIIESLGIGGAEFSLIENVRSLTQFEHLVIVLGGDQTLNKSLVDSGAEVILLNARKKNIIKNALAIRTFVISRKIDLVHTNLFYANQAGRLGAWMAGKPVISSIVSTSYSPLRYKFDKSINRRKHKLLQFIDFSTARLTNCRFIAISECVKESAIRHTRFPPNRIDVIGRGLSANYDDATSGLSINAKKKELLIEENFPVLLNVGRHVPSKGQKFVIKALPQILKKFPSAHLLMAGHGPISDELKELARCLGVENHVTFLGARRDILELHLVSDVFVFPSLWEGLGVSLLEAMKMSNPVITSNTGPFPEVVEDAKSGILVDPCSCIAIASAVERICGNPKSLISMGKRGREIFLKKFTIQVVTKQIETTYHNVLNEFSHD